MSIDISGNVAEKIGEIQKQLPEFRGKLTNLKNLHLTLKFLGDIDDYTLEKVKERLKDVRFKKFQVEIDSLGVFSEKFVRIVWLRVNDCTQLQKEIDAALEGLFPEETRFMSHLTIARVKGINDKEEFFNRIKEIKIEPLKLVVAGFELKESLLSGKEPEYKTLEEYPFED